MSMDPGDVICCKKRCCRDSTRCKKCPVVWKRLSVEGYAERRDARRYVVVDVVPKKAFKAARAKRVKTPA
jgi:hypothetical protein